MKGNRVSHIVFGALAAFAAAVLFVTYGTVLPTAPFAAIQMDGPIAVDSDGEKTVVADAESRRALILNADGDLTGVISCTTNDSPIDAITDVCISDGLVYLSGVRFVPDSDIIERERVVVYDKGGNFLGVALEAHGIQKATPGIKSLNDASDGVVVSSVQSAEWGWERGSDGNVGSSTGSNAESGTGVGDAEGANKVSFVYVNADWAYESRADVTGSAPVHDMAFSGYDGGYYVTLDVYGMLGGGSFNRDSQMYSGHVFTAIDADEEGVLYACDDKTGSLYAIAPGSEEARPFVVGEGFHSVHENNGVLSLCNSDTGKVTLCDLSGEVKSEFTEVRPSVGFSARMLLVWGSGLYLAVLALVLAVRKVRRLVKEGRTDGVGPMLLSVAVVSAVAIAVGSLSFSSYQKSLDLRANEINMSADYLATAASDLGGAFEKIQGRDVVRGTDGRFIEAQLNLLEVIGPAMTMVDVAVGNNIGLYCNVYGKDDKGVYYLCGSADEYVAGTSARSVGGGKLEDAFTAGYAMGHELLKGRTLRDTTQYRLVQIPSSDGLGVAGVIEIGSKMRSFESSITEDLAQRILALLVMVLVVYLAYSEARACGHCLLSYRKRQHKDPIGAIAFLTRPFTLGITMLTSVDSVMTVLIAKDLLKAAGMGDSSSLLALPAVMLGIGLVIGQGLYGFAGSRVGLRRFVSLGASAMLLCACLTGAAVAFGGFWLYCAAKLALSVPFGMLYALGYSLPRTARDDGVRAMAAGGVKRTDTSAAALGTVIGGYAAQMLGDGWVYVLVAVACLPVILMVLKLLPKGLAPLEEIAQPDHLNGRIRDFVKTRAALALALLVVLPATVAAGYASFLFPLFSVDLNLTKSEINNIVVLGQLVVYVCIDQIDFFEGRYGKWRVSTAAIALIGVVFLLFSVNTTLAWSLAVVAIVALLCKSSDGWKAMWLKAAGEAGVPAGRATGAMFATRSLAMVAQPFVLGALLGVADSVAVIVIGVLCVACAALFFAVTRKISAIRI